MNGGEESLLPIREVLRHRQRLAPAEVACLFAELPELIDRAGARLSPNPLLHEVLVEFATEPDLVRLVREDVRGWPGFRLRLGAGPADCSDAEATLLSPRQVQRGPPPVRFAGLLYEMLGGRVRYEELIAGRYSPLAVLGERGNEVLKLALQAGAFGDCRSVWEAWRASLETLAPAAEREAVPHWKIPAALLGLAERADVLELTPANGETSPVRLVARPEFRIGRSRRLSDLVILPSQETEEARAVVEEVSRIHVTAVHLPEALAFRDGDGQRPSSNGARWQGQPLSASAPAPIAAPGLLVLSPKGCRYEIEVTPLATAPEDRGEIANFAEWAGAASVPVEEPPAAPFTAVSFATPAQFTILRPALWLRSSVRAELQPDSTFRWGRRSETAPLFLYRAGAFWIVRTSPRAAVRVAETELAVGEAAPLAGGTTLRLGALSFTVTLPRA